MHLISSSTYLLSTICFLLILGVVTSTISIRLSVSTGFVAKLSLLGSTAKNIRKIFDYASKRECILFLDEFDVIAKLRDDKNELGELKRVVNSLIQNIDGLNSDSILIAATNHHELLDPAIWRLTESLNSH